MTDKRRELDLKYRDPRGAVVHVIAFDQEKNRVIFMREDYPHECTRPLKQFEKHFIKVTT